MDPLSITAGAIALGGFAAAIGKGIRTLKSLANIPDEFRALLNELIMLQIVARTADDLRLQVPTNFSTIECDTLCQTLTETIQRLEDIATRFNTSSRGLDKRGRMKIPRILWIQERSSIESLRQQARQSRDYIAAYLTTLNIAESSSQSSLLVEIQGITRLSLSNLASVGESARNTESRLCRVEKSLESIAGLQAEYINHSRVCETLEGRGELHFMGEVQNDNTISTSSPNLGTQSAIEWFDDRIDDRQVRADSVLSLQAALRCRLACRCSCHRSTTIHAPTSLRSVIGAFSLSYNAAVTLRSGPCNYVACNGPSTRRVQFSYYLPRWITSSALQFSALWGSVGDNGATLSLRVPRLISSDDYIWNAIVIGDLKYIQERLSTRQNFPTDVEESSGRSLIAYAVTWEYPELIKLLLQEGADAAIRSISGLSGVSRAKQHLLLGRGNDEARALYQRIVELGGEEHQSTAIHDSILGINSIEIDQAIEMEPESLNSLDATGYTPLHWAIRLGNDKAVDALLRAKAGTNARNFWLSTPLHTAVRRANLAVAKELLNAGSDPNARDMDGQTPLHDILSVDLPGLELNIEEVVKLLLQHGSNPNAIDNLYKQSPLNWYVSLPHQHMGTFEANIDALLTAGADMEKVDKHGWPPLFNCIRVHRDSRFLKAIVSRGARLDAVNNFKQTVLHAVAMWGGLETMKYLTGLAWQLLSLDTEGQDMNGYKALDYMMLRASSTPEELLDRQIPGMTTARDGEIPAFRSLICEIQDGQGRGRILEDSIGFRSLWVE